MLPFSFGNFIHFAEAFQFDEVPIGFLLLFPSPQRHIYKEDPMANVKDVAAYLFYFVLFQVSRLGVSSILSLFFIYLSLIHI